MRSPMKVLTHPEVAQIDSARRAAKARIDRKAADDIGRWRRLQRGLRRLDQFLNREYARLRRERLVDATTPEPNLATLALHDLCRGLRRRGLQVHEGEHSATIYRGRAIGDTDTAEIVEAALSTIDGAHLLSVTPGRGRIEIQAGPVPAVTYGAPLDAVAGG